MFLVLKNYCAFSTFSNISLFDNPYLECIGYHFNYFKSYLYHLLSKFIISIYSQHNPNLYFEIVLIKYLFNGGYQVHETDYFMYFRVLDLYYSYY